MVALATTCSAGHTEFVPATGQRDGVPYFGAWAIRGCRRALGGEFCGAEIEETQVVCEEHGALGAEICPCCADLPDLPVNAQVQGTGCGIPEPHGPGAHPPAIDLEPDEDEELDRDQEDLGCRRYAPIRYESDDEEEDDATPTDNPPHGGPARGPGPARPGVHHLLRAPGSLDPGAAWIVRHV
jgi:hypothetical protein